ncbi:MAG: redox-sensing transcriptional repressor Rex [Candidatus Caldatribacterium sp.]|uniref:redox-sensing transcriptional repressor Rex n=1 Tax=Candidatus Caldatribacterium sp. TaxID=2282143 RepID=UPI0029974CBC|nr:redox-sensing transcriptional repressor Rex [Candidatus Caldatribacterium sp.]MCX7729731.1 redox-sensing transcriptional repressor Rex [Candidatus Caldatribacterium sp.]MDW8081153.1 redox-sensing transcriptional repressor Rex [Candidatus Calescibacterium sp.]
MQKIPHSTVQRLVLCYSLAQKALTRGDMYLRSQDIAALLQVDETQIRKDMAIVGIGGVQKRGYPVHRVVQRLEELFAVRMEKLAALIGVGNLGRALLNYPGFAKYGVRIVCAFDRDPEKVGREVNRVFVYPIEALGEVIPRFGVQMAILAIPPHSAQEVADALVALGVRGIWNFSSALLRVPREVAVRNECLESGLLLLLHKMWGENHVSFPKE